MPDEPWKIQVSRLSTKLQTLEAFQDLPILPTKQAQTDLELSEIADSPIPLTAQEEKLWYNTVVTDRSGQLYLLGAILKSHGLRDDLIISALARHPLSIDKYLGRQLLEAKRIVEKLQNSPQGKKLDPSYQALKLWDWLSFMTKPLRVTWLVDELWIEHSVGFISGRAKSYKSWLALDLAISVATKTLFLGKFETNKQGPVLIVQEEDPHSVIQERMTLISNNKGISPHFCGSCNTLEAYYNCLPIHIINLQGFKLDKEEKTKELVRIIQQLKPVLVILDPFINMVTELDEYRGSQVANILLTVKAWREEFGCAVVIVHHWNKKATTNSGGANMYGSFAFHAWLESALHIRPITEDEVQVTEEIIVEREFKAARPEGPFKVKFGRQLDERLIYNPQVMPPNKTNTENVLDIIKGTPNILHSELVKLTDTPTKVLARLLNKFINDGTIIATGVTDGKKRRLSYRLTDKGVKNN